MLPIIVALNAIIYFPSLANVPDLDGVHTFAEVPAVAGTVLASLLPQAFLVLLTSLLFLQLLSLMLLASLLLLPSPHAVAIMIQCNRRCYNVGYFLAVK